MKRIIISLVLIAIHATALSSETPTGTFLNNSSSIGIGSSPNVLLIQDTYISDSKPYTNGGLTITYPVGTFIGNPFVFTNIAFPTGTGTYSSVVTANSNTSTTIFVYNISPIGVVTEAGTGDVTVFILAFGS